MMLLIIVAGSIIEHPTQKFASSPTNAVDVGLKSNFTIIFTNSVRIPATGPNANPQIKTGNSLKSIL